MKNDSPQRIRDRRNFDALLQLPRPGILMQAVKVLDNDGFDGGIKSKHEIRNSNSNVQNSNDTNTDVGPLFGGYQVRQ